MKTNRRTLLAGTAAAATGALFAAPAAHAQTRHGSRPKPTVVLVHGAFADASGWNGVATRLIRDGYPVIAPANPLRGVSADSAYLASVLATLGGPLVLVAHSYGGMSRLAPRPGRRFPRGISSPPRTTSSRRRRSGSWHSGPGRTPPRSVPRTSR